MTSVSSWSLFHMSHNSTRMKYCEYSNNVDNNLSYYIHVYQACIWSWSRIVLRSSLPCSPHPLLGPDKILTCTCFEPRAYWLVWRSEHEVLHTIFDSTACPLRLYQVVTLVLSTKLPCSQIPVGQLSVLSAFEWLALTARRGRLLECYSRHASWRSSTTPMLPLC